MTREPVVSHPLDSQAAENPLPEILQTIDQGTMLVDRDLRLVSWNKQFEALQFAPPDCLYRGAPLDTIYQQIADRGIFGAGDPAAIALNRISRLTAGQLIESELLRSPSGGWVRIKRVRLQNGGVLALFTDLTGPNKLSEQTGFEQRQRQAAKLEAIGQLCGGVAHDFNNLLSVILGNLDMAIEAGGRDNPYIHRAIEAVEKGSDSVQRLLSFARQQPLEKTLTDVGKLLSQFVPLFPPLLGEHIAINLEKPAQPLVCELDANQLETVVMNLVINSRDAILNNGTITLGLKNTILTGEQANTMGVAAGPYVRIEVLDTGCGMPADILAKATDPFYTSKPTGLGTGLGLSRAEAFCEQCEGALSIVSQPGGGTSVRLFIPCAQHKLA